MGLTFSRMALLEWIQNVTEGLRIGYGIVDGKRVAFARFSHLGVEHEVEATGDEPDEEIVRTIAETVRYALRLPPLFAPDRSAELEQEIVRASLEGDDAHRDALTRELVMGRTPVPFQGLTKFGKGRTW